MHAHRDVTRLVMVFAMTGCSLHLELGGSDEGDDSADTGSFEDGGDLDGGGGTGYQDEGGTTGTGVSVGSFDSDDATSFEDEGGFVSGFESGFETSGCFDGDDGGEYESGAFIGESGGFIGGTGSDEFGGTDGLDDGGCQPPPPPEPIDRALIETHPEALSSLPLRDVLAALAQNAEFEADPVGFHDRLFETYTIAALGTSPAVPHCDDEAPANRATLDGYPLECPRQEEGLQGFIDGWMTIAVVNRFDLAPADGANCGEQRIVFAHPQFGRAFIILEAQIPNPSPGCGIAACTPIVEFWATQGTISDSIARGERLREAFLTGEPSLQAAGFEPFVDAANYTFGTGQLRTNNFLGNTWTLREFKIVDEDGTLIARPVPVTANAFGRHFDDSFAHVRGAQCRDAILDAIPDLLTDDVARMGLVLAEGCNAGESQDDSENDFSAHLSNSSGFQAAIEERIQSFDPGSELTAFDIAERARFAGSCIGCHQQSVGFPLGNDRFAPFSLGFVHIGEFTSMPCEDGAFCFEISDALQSVFLPHRRGVMLEFLEQFGGTSCQARAASGVGVAPSLADRATSVSGRARRTIGGRPVGGH